MGVVCLQSPLTEDLFEGKKVVPKQPPQLTEDPLRTEEHFQAWRGSSQIGDGPSRVGFGSLRQQKGHLKTFMQIMAISILARALSGLE